MVIRRVFQKVNRRANFARISGFSTALNENKTSMMSERTLVIGQGIISQQRDALARGITLIESTRTDHTEQASLLLSWLHSQSSSSSMKKQSLRIGVAGPPGAGKSTFIEALGLKYISQNHRVAVVPVDPSSHISGGSILGDKTRMEKLSLSDNAYIRASPTRGVLGGIAEHTSDVIYLCESAGYDIVFVESVGLGQSEVDIDNAVDILLIVLPPGGGDGLQASKKGIMEAADIVVINKADGNLLASAKHAKAEYSAAISFIRQKNAHWHPCVLMLSSRTGEGLDGVFDKISQFSCVMTDTGSLNRKRLDQSTRWMWSQFRRLVISSIENDAAIKARARAVEPDLLSGSLVPRSAAALLFREYRDSHTGDLFNERSRNRQ